MNLRTIPSEQHIWLHLLHLTRLSLSVPITVNMVWLDEIGCGIVYITDLAVSPLRWNSDCTNFYLLDYSLLFSHKGQYTTWPHTLWFLVPWVDQISCPDVDRCSSSLPGTGPPRNKIRQIRHTYFNSIWVCHCVVRSLIQLKYID